MRLDSLPRLELATLPTPLDPAPRLSAALGGPTIYLKRDDLTGLALGGNKVRKLDYLLADAQAQGADCVITTGALQSNHCRQTAAAAARLGLTCYLVLAPPFVGDGQGNALLDRLFGAHAVRIDSRDRDAILARIDALAEELRADGRRPYTIPGGGSNPLGACGYVQAMRELAGQCARLGIRPTHLFHATGSAGTQAGIEVGVRAYLPGTRVVGVAVSRPAEYGRPMVASLANETAAFLDLDQRYAPEDILIDDRHIGAAYGELTAGCVEAISLTARQEGVLLDPVYAGKAMAGLIAWAREGRLTRDDTAIFVHTGGLPALFAYAEGLLAGLGPALA